jgi:hypothetical protein
VRSSSEAARRRECFELQPAILQTIDGSRQQVCVPCRAHVRIEARLGASRSPGACVRVDERNHLLGGCRCVARSRGEQPRSHPRPRVVVPDRVEIGARIFARGDAAALVEPLHREHECTREHDHAETHERSDDPRAPSTARQRLQQIVERGPSLVCRHGEAASERSA